MPAISTSVSRRAIASRGELACTVESEPSWPVFIACSMSRLSPPRTSPTTMRSGRMRSELRTRSRMVISPLPSMFGGRALEPDHVLLLELQLDRVLDGDDALSLGDERGQHVEQRRLAGAGAAGDDDVQPRLDAGLEQLGHLGDQGAEADQVVDLERVLGELPDGQRGPLKASGGMIALTREPSASRASTSGDDSSMRRPTSATRSAR